MDYSTYDTSYSLTRDNASSGLSMGILFAYFAVLAFIFVSMWRVFSKAGKPGWAVFIPIYNTLTFLQIVGRPLWWFFLLLIPFVNIVVAILLANDLSKSFGKGVGFTVGLLLLPFIFGPILAFGGAQYHAPAAKA